jgi:capsular polysaccharide transport system ATP-binding protein
MKYLEPEPSVSVEPSSADAEGREIVVSNLVKEFETENGKRRVLDGISFKVAMGERIAILGRNGAGKSTLIKILSGLMRPSSGDIYRGLKMSWPLALGGGFEGSLTGYDNVRFISRMYGAPFKETYEYVEDFTELGEKLHTSVKYYSDGMRMRLAFALSLAINFECFLIDEVLLVGDQRFQKKCHRELFERRSHCGMILAIHGVDIVKEYCHSALVLKDGRGRVFNDVVLATEIYATL